MIKIKISACALFLIMILPGLLSSTVAGGMFELDTILTSSSCMSNEVDCFDSGAGESINEIDRGSPGACLKAIDYDGDGDMDYIEGSNEFVFIATNTDSHFEKTMVYNFFLSPDPDSGNINMLVYGGVTVGDFNNDGQQDFITGGAMGNIRLFVNNDSQPGFPNFDNYTIARFGQAAYGLDVADFNEDGWLDFAVSWATHPLGYSTITLFYNRGNLCFTQKDVYQLEPEYYIEDLNVGDYDNDGDIDIIFLKTLFEWHGHNPPWPINVIGAYYLLENTGDETFGSERLIAERGRGVSFWLGLRFYLTVQSRIRNYYGFNRINPHITSADFDEDGDIDFLIGDNSGMVEFFRNDGQGNFVSDGVIHRYGYLSWGLASADFDDDGDIDFLVAALDKYDDPSLGHIWLKENQLNPSKTNGQPDG